MTKRGGNPVRSPVSGWRVSHVDIAGGIIETRDGDYEITRVIGRDIGLERVRADIRLMAAAPALLDVAARLHGAWEKRRGEVTSGGDPALDEDMAELGRLIREALDLVESG